MGYEVYTDHPESFDRRAQDFAAWSLWAPQNAPWTGISISEQAKLLQAVCDTNMLPEACETLDAGGTITPKDARDILRLPTAALPLKVREVFQHAARNGYGVRVIFSKGFGAISASAYLAKHGSA